MEILNSVMSIYAYNPRCDNDIPYVLYTLYTLHCIVLYLRIYRPIALLAVNTNQKRFQCESQREESTLERTKRGMHLAHQLIVSFW